MNKTRRETVAYLTDLVAWAQASELPADLAVFPPFTALDTAAEQLAASSAARGRPDRSGPLLRLGAQNMHWQARGAETGEISAEMLLDCGVTIVEIGHYERRTRHGETDRSVNLKAKAAIAAGLEALICVGDGTDDRTFGVSAETVARQVKTALFGLPAEALSSVILAYEPGWAIGVGGEQARPEYVDAMHEVIRTAVQDSHGADGAEQIRVVYGGSVDAASARGHASQASVDGLFIGRAALTAAGFIAAIEEFCAALAGPADQLICVEGTCHDRA